MYKEEEKQIREAISLWEEQGRFVDDERIVLFGAGDFSRGILKVLREKERSSSFLIIDNDKNKRNSYCAGVPVAFPEDLSSEDKKGLFIICSHFWTEMKNQLIHLGVSQDRIFVIHLSTFEEDIEENTIAVYRGRDIYRKIRKEYLGCEIFLCPYTGTGDMYLIGTYLFQYLKKENIKDYVLIVVSKACQKVADIFSVQNVVIINGSQECRYLTRYYMLCPKECKLKILNDSWGNVYTNPVQWFRGLHGMNFSEMFRIFVFNLDKGVKPKHPNFINKESDILTFSKEHNMKKGKSVLLAPYSTTLTSLPFSFWISVSDELKKKGFMVFTNVGGETEKPLPGTEGIFIPLNIAPQMVSWMGTFIGVRSGLCDVISGSDAKKIILYDKNNRFFNVTAYEYFSLTEMGLSDDAIEIEYDGVNEGRLKDEVLKYL